MFSDLSSIKTEGVRVDVQTAWIRDQSNPSLDHYVFAYKIRITNESRFEVQLMSRKWIITNGLGEKRVVQGDGVIGQQPVLDSGEEFTYTSGCLLETPVGTMEGYYVMRTQDGREFQTPIEPFLLAVPGTIN